MAAKKTARKKKPKGCDCIARANNALAPKGVRVVSVFSLTGGPTRVMVELMKREDAVGRVKIPIMAATYCPFCGKNYDE